jgi:F-type H+-transporting ATPase subunit alpha
LSDERGGGSLTALPIIETQAGDVSAYIPTNVISITDGQIYLESDLLRRHTPGDQRRTVRLAGGRSGPAQGNQQGSWIAAAGFGPVSRTGSVCSIRIGPRPGNQSATGAGQRATEVLKQPENHPLAMEQEAMILFALSQGYLDDIPVDKIQEWEAAFQQYMTASHPGVEEAIRTDLQITPETEKDLRASIDEFKKSSQF